MPNQLPAKTRVGEWNLYALNPHGRREGLFQATYLCQLKLVAKPHGRSPTWRQLKPIPFLTGRLL